MELTSHAEVIAAFGGQVALARALGVEPTKACHWNERGIPAKHWHKVEKLGRSAGIHVTAQHLEVIPRRRKIARSVNGQSCSDVA